MVLLASIAAAAAANSKTVVESYYIVSERILSFQVVNIRFLYIKVTRFVLKIILFTLCCRGYAGPAEEERRGSPLCPIQRSRVDECQSIGV
jgi:hypothetical protein